jgi:deoxycytidine triphosphate deaminase/intein/homing endonuclease
MPEPKTLISAPGVKSDRWIRKMALEQRMIEPFCDRQVRDGVISYGLSSYGYDLRIADEFRIFTNLNTTIVDPKNFDTKSLVDFNGAVCIIPPNSFALGRSVEYFRIPRNIITICVGKCLSGEAQVIDAGTGRLANIADLVSQGGTTASLQRQSVTRAEIMEGTRQGVLPVYELKTGTGRTITATSNHPLLTFTGWRPLGSLLPGDRIGVPRRMPIFGTRTLPEWEVDLLGLLISDGQCATPGHSPRYTSGDPVLREYFGRAVAQFGGVPKPVGRMSVNATNRGRRGGVMERNRVYTWLAGMGLAVRSPDKFVPPCIFELRPRLLARFLQALFSGDGGISFSDTAIHLEFSTTSERLAREVHHLLLRFEILAMLRFRPTASGRGTYVLSITSKEHIARFAAAIGFVPGSQKQKKLEHALAVIDRSPQKKSNFDTLPREAWSLLAASCRSRGMSLLKAGIPRTQPNQSVPRALARELACRLSDEALGRVADSDVLWDTIREQRFVGFEPVYDLTLPETANFVANDVFVHNSTYARCGIITNVTPFEPEWEGFVTLEISNTTPLPARIYANEGIAQVLFFEGDEACELSYADKKGKYQGQKEVTLPRI